MDALKRDAAFPGVSYSKYSEKKGVVSRTFSTCDYWVPNTIGYYQLRNTLTKVTDPFNMYMFVSDANAPLPSYNVDVSDKDEDWWSDKDNALLVANSFFLLDDERLFDDIGNCELPDAIGQAMYNCYYGSKGPTRWSEHVANRSKNLASTWNTLLESSKGYHYHRKLDMKSAGITSGTYEIGVVFGSGMANPYTSNNVIIAKRDNWAKFKAGNNANYWNSTNRGYNTRDKIVEFPVHTKNTSKSVRYEGFPFILGLPPEHTGSNNAKTKFIDGGWRQKYEKLSKDDFRSWLGQYILNHAFNVTSEDETLPTGVPLSRAIWYYTIDKYVDHTDTSHHYDEWKVEWDEEENAYIVTIEEGSEEEGTDPVTVAIPLEGAQWIDKHLCPYPLWSDSDRLNDAKNSRIICRYGLDEQNMELIPLFLIDSYVPESEEDTEYTKYKTSALCSDYYVCLITYLCSGKSAISRFTEMGKRVSSNAFGYGRSTLVYSLPDDNFVLTKAPTDYVTIEYGYNNPDSEEHEWTRTGGLKIVTLNENIKAGDKYTGGDQVRADGDVMLDVQDDANSVYSAITRTDTIEYPMVWDDARRSYVHRWYVVNYPDSDKRPQPSDKYIKFWNCESADSIAIVKFVKEFYTHIKKAMPVLMGHRYQKYIFGDFTNSLDKSVLDYDDEENTFVIKTLPVMNDEGLEELFRSAFKNSGNFQAGKQFSYSHCIVDLNPDIYEYNTSVPEDLSDKAEFKL